MDQSDQFTITHYPPRSFGLWTGYFFTINCIIGAGFLGIPWAYEKSGWLFSLIYQIFAQIQAYHLAIQIVEVMSRTEVILNKKELGIKTKKPQFKRLFSSPSQSDPLLDVQMEPDITDRLINTPDSFKACFGNKWGMFYIICLGLYLFGTMIAYGSIFASSFAANIPIYFLDTCDIYAQSGFLSSCRINYWIFLTIFAIIVCYLTIIGMEEQQVVQIITSFLRFLVIFLVILIPIFSMIFDDSYNKNLEISAPPLINLQYVPSSITILLFASSFQIHVPTITQVICEKEKHLKTINFLAVLTCFILYSLVGLSVSFYSDQVPKMASLLFRNFSAGYPLESRPLWAALCEYLIIICPAIDVVTCYPIKSLTISDAIITWQYGTKVHEVKRSVVILNRFLVSISPLIVCYIFYDLADILYWIGLLVFVIMQIAFPLMHLAMKIMVPGRSKFDIIGTPLLNWIIIFTNFLLMIIVISGKFLGYS